MLETLLGDIGGGYAIDQLGLAMPLVMTPRGKAFFADGSVSADFLYLGSLYYKGTALVVPDVQFVKIRILQFLHDASCVGHVGGHRTPKMVSRLYWWPKMAAEVHTYVQGCEVCQRNKGSRSQKYGELVPLPIPDAEWDFVTADRITHLPKTDKDHTAILVVVDNVATHPC